MFKVRNYDSSEQYDIGKFLNFKVDVYDVINSPLLNQLLDLPTVQYYVVENGNEDIDKISTICYGSPFLSYYIQFYNSLTTDTIPEGTKLRLFNLEDLDNLCNSLYI